MPLPRSADFCGWERDHHAFPGMMVPLAASSSHRVTVLFFHFRLRFHIMDKQSELSDIDRDKNCIVALNFSRQPFHKMRCKKALKRSGGHSAINRENQYKIGVTCQDWYRISTLKILKFPHFQVTPPCSALTVCTCVCFGVFSTHGLSIS